MTSCDLRCDLAVAIPGDCIDCAPTPAAGIIGNGGGIPAAGSRALSPTTERKIMNTTNLRSALDMIDRLNVEPISIDYTISIDYEGTVAVHVDSDDMRAVLQYAHETTTMRLRTCSEYPCMSAMVADGVKWFTLRTLRSLSADERERFDALRAAE